MVYRVLERNESLQAKALEFEVNRRKYHAARGIFEPEAYTSATHEFNHRQNSSEQASADSGQPVLREENNLYEGGLESLVFTGARVKLGYSLSDLKNNIPPGTFQPGISNNQYQSFLGVSVTQPLLKNFGSSATMAEIRLAALSSKIAFQDYRKQLMTLVATAEATYWNLYLAQEQVRFFEESLKTAQTILKDNRTRLDAGKGSELEVLEAQAGVGLRQSKLAEARQRVLEAVNRVLSFYAEAASKNTTFAIRAVDVPQIISETLDYQALRQCAFDMNPDILNQQEKRQQDLIRLDYAKNQRLPEFNLKGAFGENGLGGSPGSSWDALDNASYPSWSVGVELRVPLGGGIKTRNELNAARSQLQVSELALRSLQTEILNSTDTTWHKIQSTRETVTNYQSSVNYNQKLLDAALARLEAGKIESRKVFEVESDLFEAKNAVVESLVRHELARLELEVLQGSLLKKRHLEITQNQLQKATQHFEGSRQIGDASYRETTREIQNLYRAQISAEAAGSSTNQQVHQ